MQQSTDLFPSELDAICINTLRFSAVDMVQKANSGHPGLPQTASRQERGWSDASADRTTPGNAVDPRHECHPASGCQRSVTDNPARKWEACMRRGNTAGRVAAQKTPEIGSFFATVWLVWVYRISVQRLVILSYGFSM